MQTWSKSLVLSDRIYRFLLLAYPSSFRRDYGAEMAQVFRDECRSRLKHDTPGGLTRLWIWTLGDWSGTVLKQHIEEAFHMSGQKWLIRLGALAAVAGGIVGIYLAAQGPNSYGNFGWDGWLAPVVAVLFALGLGCAVAAYHQRLGPLGWSGAALAVIGLLLVAVGHAVDALWPLIFIGPVVIVPIGSLLLGISIYRDKSTPTWWRVFPFLICAIALGGFTIEVLEGATGNSTPDRGMQMTEALFSLAWIGLGVGLWLTYEQIPDEPQLPA